jgi:hypothetical protein
MAEKVRSLAHLRSQKPHLRFSDGKVFDTSGKPWTVIETFLEEPSYFYFIDDDGDIAREPQGQPWSRPAADKLPMNPLAAYREVSALASIRFGRLPFETVTYYESELLEPDRALAAWEAAAALTGQTGLAPLIRAFPIQECQLADFLEELTKVPAERREAASIEVAPILTQRQVRLEQALAEADEDEGLERPADALASLRDGLEQQSPDELAPHASKPFVFQTEGKYVVLTLVACEPWELPVCIGFGGWNEAPYPVVQSAVLRHWSLRYGAELVATGGAYLEMRTKQALTPSQLKTLAWEQFLFAEDSVLQGTETVAALAQEIASGHWFFWWD